MRLALIVIGGLMVIQCGPLPEKKVALVDSYASQHLLSRVVRQQVKAAFASEGYSLTVFELNGNQDPNSAVWSKVSSDLANDRPDVVIANEDAAIALAHDLEWTESPIPVVNIGANWQGTGSGYKGSIHNPPILEVIDSVLKFRTQISSIHFLSENVESERVNRFQYERQLAPRGFQTQYNLFTDIESWKNAWAQAQRDADLIFLTESPTMLSWDQTELLDFVHRASNIPVVTNSELLVPYAVFGICVDRKEEIAQVIQMVESILGETSDEVGPIVAPPRRYMFNPEIANLAGLQMSSWWRQQAE